MSNQLKKLKKRKTKKFEPIKLPANIRFHTYVADYQGCGTIRVMYPHMMLNQFRMEGVNISTSYNNFFTTDPNFYKDMLFVQFQRSATKAQFDLLSHFKASIGAQTKTPIVYEIDDMLIGIPEWNFAHDYYKDLEQYIPKIMSMVDGMIVSTPKLKEVYGKFCKNIRIIPNHLPKWIWGEPYEPNIVENRKPRILWAGSQNHFAVKKGSKGGDFDKDLMNFIRKTTDKYEWVICGAIPQELQDLAQSGRVDFKGWNTPFQYPQFVKDLNIDLAMAPLSKSLFNSCKSNIKMLEYTVIGAPAVYTNIDPYANAKYKSDSGEEMIAQVEKLAEDNDLRKEAWEQDYNTVESQLYWEDHNNLRHYIDTYLRLFKMRLP